MVLNAPERRRRENRGKRRGAGGKAPGLRRRRRCENVAAPGEWSMKERKRVMLLWILWILWTQNFNRLRVGGGWMERGAVGAGCWVDRAFNAVGFMATSAQGAAFGFGRPAPLGERSERSCRARSSKTWNAPPASRSGEESLRLRRPVDIKSLLLEHERVPDSVARVAQG
jgi:hypothetical protein